MDRIKIPSQGEDKEKLLDEMQSFREKDADWKAGKTWSLVYYAGEEHYEFLKKLTTSSFQRMHSTRWRSKV